jgi:hypothetical protein
LRWVSADELPANTVPQVVAIFEKIRNSEVYSDHNFR